MHCLCELHYCRDLLVAGDKGKLGMKTREHMLNGPKDDSRRNNRLILGDEFVIYVFTRICLCSTGISIIILILFLRCNPPTSKDKNVHQAAREETAAEKDNGKLY